MIQKFEFKGLDMKGAYEITPFYATDERGGFIKDYNIDAFKQNGIDHELKENHAHRIAGASGKSGQNHYQPHRRAEYGVFK